MARICFLNPFGTDSYDELIGATLQAGAARLHRGRDPPPGPRPAQHRLLRAQAPGRDGDHDGRGRSRARRVRRLRHRVLLRPRRSRQCRELVNIPVVGPLEASVLLSRLFGHSLRRRHRPPQGGARAARPRPPVRAGGQLPGRRRHRLVRHRHGARPDDRRQGHLRQGAGRDAHAPAPRPSSSAARSCRPATSWPRCAATPSWLRCRS